MLTEAFQKYLVDRDREAMARALSAAGREEDSWLLQQQGWANQQVWVGPSYPSDLPVGKVWFDTVELCRMQVIPSEPLISGENYHPRVVAAWRPQAGLLSMEAVPSWKLRAFQNLAPFHPKTVAGWWDAERLWNRPETSAARAMFWGEALLYANWFGKCVPDPFFWQQVPELDEFWRENEEEWCPGEECGIRLRPEWIEDPPLSARMSPVANAPGLGFRTAIDWSVGLMRGNPVDFGDIPFHLDGRIGR